MSGHNLNIITYAVDTGVEGRLEKETTGFRINVVEENNKIN